MGCMNRDLYLFILVLIILADIYQPYAIHYYYASSYEITKRYLGIIQDDKDSVFLSVNL